MWRPGRAQHAVGAAAVFHIVFAGAQRTEKNFHSDQAGFHKLLCQRGNKLKNI